MPTPRANEEEEVDNEEAQQTTSPLTLSDFSEQSTLFELTIEENSSKIKAISFVLFYSSKRLKGKKEHSFVLSN